MANKQLEPFSAEKNERGQWEVLERAEPVPELPFVHTVADGLDEDQAKAVAATLNKIHKRRQRRESG